MSTDLTTVSVRRAQPALEARFVHKSKAAPTLAGRHERLVSRPVVADTADVGRGGTENKLEI